MVVGVLVLVLVSFVAGCSVNSKFICLFLLMRRFHSFPKSGSNLTCANDWMLELRQNSIAHWLDALRWWNDGCFMHRFVSCVWFFSFFSSSHKSMRFLCGAFNSSASTELLVLLIFLYTYVFMFLFLSQSTVHTFIRSGCFEYRKMKT